jgi:phospholipid/cholesterol/gamma-HCH transport system substrate-binding protein
VRLLGGLFVVAVLVASVLVGAQFEGAFDRYVPVTVLADRAGLLMDRGADVKVLGVVVGQVRSVTTTGSGADLEIGLYPSMVDRVPTDVTANVLPLTIFGSKYVELVRPPGQHSPPIRAGAVISGGHVSVRIDETFQHLLDDLDAIQPSQFNTALSAVANTLSGNGAKIGQLSTDLDRYLKGLNPSLPALHQDLDQAPAVLGTYTDVTPDLLRIGGNLGATSDLLVTHKAQLTAFLLSLTDFGHRGADFLSGIQDPLAGALSVLNPTTRLLAEYSTMFPCLFQGLELNRDLLNRTADSGVHITVTPALGVEPYRYPRDLATIMPGTGPDCHAMAAHR